MLVLLLPLLHLGDRRRLLLLLLLVVVKGVERSVRVLVPGPIAVLDRVRRGAAAAGPAERLLLHRVGLHHCWRVTQRPRAGGARQSPAARAPRGDAGR